MGSTHCRASWRSQLLQSPRDVYNHLATYCWVVPLAVYHKLQPNVGSNYFLQKIAMFSTPKPVTRHEGHLSVVQLPLDMSPTPSGTQLHVHRSEERLRPPTIWAGVIHPSS